MNLEGLLDWTRQTLGRDILAVKPITTGNARVTIRLTLDETPPRQVILRHEAGAGPLSGTIFSLEREADVCRAVQGRGLPTPAVLAEDRAAAILLTECLTGALDFRNEALDDYLGCLRRLHDLEPAALGLAGFQSSIPGELANWREVLNTKAPGSSAIADHAFDALRRHLPAEPRRPVLCHGDPGAGNYLCEGATVTALLDWEMAHFGDPMDDLAWITIRAALYGIDLGDFGARVAQAYGADGVDLHDGHRQRFWQAVGFLRMLVICLSASAAPRAGKERLLQMTLVPALEFQVLESLAALEGRSVIDRLASAELEPGAFPVELMREMAADVNDALLPQLRSNDALANWTKRIRNLLTELAAGAAPTASEAATSQRSLVDQAAARLRWLPAGRDQAARKPAAFTTEAYADAG